MNDRSTLSSIQASAAIQANSRIPESSTADSGVRAERAGSVLVVLVVSGPGRRC